MVLARWTARDEHFISADLPWSHEHLRSTNDFVDRRLPVVARGHFDRSRARRLPLCGLINELYLWSGRGWVGSFGF